MQGEAHLLAGVQTLLDVRTICFVYIDETGISQVVVDILMRSERAFCEGESL